MLPEIAGIWPIFTENLRISGYSWPWMSFESISNSDLSPTCSSTFPLRSCLVYPCANLTTCPTFNSSFSSISVLSFHKTTLRMPLLSHMRRLASFPFFAPSKDFDGKIARTLPVTVISFSPGSRSFTRSEGICTSFFAAQPNSAAIMFIRAPSEISPPVFCFSISSLLSI